MQITKTEGLEEFYQEKIANELRYIRDILQDIKIMQYGLGIGVISAIIILLIIIMR